LEQTFVSFIAYRLSKHTNKQAETPCCSMLRIKLQTRRITVRRITDVPKTVHGGSVLVYVFVCSSSKICSTKLKDPPWMNYSGVEFLWQIFFFFVDQIFCPTNFLPYPIILVFTHNLQTFSKNTNFGNTNFVNEICFCKQKMWIKKMVLQNVLWTQKNNMRKKSTGGIEQFFTLFTYFSIGVLYEWIFNFYNYIICVKTNKKQTTN